MVATTRCVTATLGPTWQNLVWMMFLLDDNETARVVRCGIIWPGGQDHRSKRANQGPAALLATGSW